MKKNWWKESIVYQIYPKSFNDSNGDGIGDIRGIIEKLDYLKELGVNVLWISPMLESPQDDNGYDISDYRRIYKNYGTMEDYRELLFQAHERGIKVLMDLVVNHTSDEHRWFLESKKSKDNPYRDYYIWKNPVNGKEPNNWGSVFGGSAWEYDNETQMYYLHLFSKKQPDLNWENEKVRQEVYDMMKFWCDKGIDGFRMDVISMISKDQAFPDGEVKSGLYGDFGPYSVHGPRVHEFLQEMNREVLSKYDIMTVGETSGVTIEEAQKYAGEDSGELNMVFQFEHVEDASPHAEFGKWTTDRYDFKAFKKTMIKWQEELQGKAWNSLFLGNHDQPRSVSRFGNDNPAYRETSAKMLATCLHMMQGTPYVYQGEELGMTNVYFDKLEDYRDIESINFFTELTESGLMTPEYMMKCLMLRSRDNARTPMQWDDSEQAGFTDGESWIKVNPNYKEINAAQQLKDPNSIFHYYQKLISLRKEKDIIVYGEFEPLYRDDEQIFAYTRKLDQEKLLTVCNFSDKNAEMEIPEEFKGAECLITNLDRTVFEGKIVLKPYEAFVLYEKIRGSTEMIRKYRYGAPFDTEALTEKIETAEEAFPYGEISQKEGFAFTYIMDEDDIVYGLGESNRGINKRGYCYISNCTDDPIHTEDKRSLYGAHNFIIVSGKTTFGLFFDYPSKLTFDIGYTRMDTLKVSCENADLDIYVIEGENAYDIVKQFRRVIGRSYIPPKFAFGFGQSRWGYTTKEDFRAVAKGYR